MIYKTDLLIGKSVRTMPKNNCLELLTFDEVLTYVLQVCDLSYFNSDFDVHLPFTVIKSLINNITYSYLITFNNQQQISLMIDIESPYNLLTSLKKDVDFTFYIRDKKLKELIK